MLSPVLAVFLKTDHMDGFRRLSGNDKPL